MRGVATTERLHRLQVRTPEGVMFTLQLASPVLRLLALILDGLVVTAAWSVIGGVLALLNAVSRDLAAAVAIVGYFLLTQSYNIVCEWRWRGQSLGKRMMRLRVVDAGGLRLTIPQVVLRNLLRFVDGLPGLYLVGGVAALVNRRGQRLGDLVAGTVVINESPEPTPDLGALRSEKYNSLRAHARAVARLRQGVSPAEARVAWQALARRDDFADAVRVKLFGTLAARFKALSALPAETTEGVPDEQFVRNVVDVLFINRV